jgi:bacillithiol system protein YtxJ
VGQFDGDVALIDVDRFHRLGQEVAQRTGVPHESPQVIVLRDGEAIWDADHWRIAVDGIEEAVRAFT